MKKLVKKLTQKYIIIPKKIIQEISIITNLNLDIDEYYNKLWKNNDTKSVKNNTKVFCNCGSYILKNNYKNHQNSKKHKNFSENKKEKSEENNMKKYIQSTQEFKRQIEYLNDIINNNNTYVKNCQTNKKKDVNSFSYLIDRKLSQSDCIKLGNGIERVISDIVVSKKTHFINIKSKNIKGKKERDLIFKDDNQKIIYYSEFKSNINLDTEKSKAT